MGSFEFNKATLSEKSIMAFYGLMHSYFEHSSLPKFT